MVLPCQGQDTCQIVTTEDQLMLYYILYSTSTSTSTSTSNCTSTTSTILYHAGPADAEDVARSPPQPEPGGPPARLAWPARADYYYYYYYDYCYLYY